MHNKEKIISAGFVVRSKDGKYLLGKTNPNSDQSWSVFKGHAEADECLIETAIRELKEETSIDINKDVNLQNNISTSPIHQYRVKNKDVYIFLLDDKMGVLDNFEFKCDSYWAEGMPEIIEFQWFDLNDMSSVIFNSQKGLIDLLKRMET